jgi:hypothetical protein
MRYGALSQPVLRIRSEGYCILSHNQHGYREREAQAEITSTCSSANMSVPRSRAPQAGRERRTCSGRMKRARVRALRESERSDGFGCRDSSRRPRQTCPATEAHARRECAGPTDRSLKQETAETTSSQCHSSRKASDRLLTHRHSSSHRSRADWPRPEVYRSRTPRRQSSRPRRPAKDR